MNWSNLHVTDQVREWPILNMARAHILYTRGKTRFFRQQSSFLKYNKTSFYSRRRVPCYPTAGRKSKANTVD